MPLPRQHTKYERGDAIRVPGDFGALSDLMESETRSNSLIGRIFYAEVVPSPDRGRGHASAENALAGERKIADELFGTGAPGMDFGEMPAQIPWNREGLQARLSKIV